MIPSKKSWKVLLDSYLRNEENHQCILRPQNYQTNCPNEALYHDPIKQTMKSMIGFIIKGWRKSAGQSRNSGNLHIG